MCVAIIMADPVYVLNPSWSALNLFILYLALKSGW